MRKSINIAGFKHGNNPVPAASLLGNLLVSGAIFGTDLSTGKVAETPEQQCANMFIVLRELLAAAGGGLDDVVRMTFYLRPEVSREIVNAQWVLAFPDADSRPARHVKIDERLPAGQHLQCDVMAVIGGEGD